MEIKPELNLKWYKNVDSYSDGDVENIIIHYIQENMPEDYGKTIIDHYSWPVYYHLTHTRKNLLNWYPFKKSAAVLEIGCGMGAITGLLCDKCSKVTAVELSKRRAEAARLRCREKENLEIIVGNLNDIEFTEKFDYITLIGVLEYQGEYTDTDDPYQDFLSKLKSLLKEDGKLLIAIENKYGVKYWCGAPEDHTGIPFDGLNQYKLSGRKVKTFSKEELRLLLKRSGFEFQFYYYPFPDYKLPTVVYSEEYLPQNASMENMVPYYVPSDKTLLIEEEGLMKDIIKNKVFDFFSNSFLVECSFNEIKEERVIFAVMNSKRQSEYRIGTAIMDSATVVKYSLDMNNIYARNHIQECYNNINRLSSMGLSVLPHEIKDYKLTLPFETAPTLADAMADAARNKDKALILRMTDHILELIEKSSAAVEPERCIIYELGLDDFQKNIDYGKVMSVGYIDMIPRNCFMYESGMSWYDQEWVLDNVPSKFILFRGLFETWCSFPEIEKTYPFNEILMHYGIDRHYNVFSRLNGIFFKMVMDMRYGGGGVEHRDRNIYRKNIIKITH